MERGTDGESTGNSRKSRNFENEIDMHFKQFCTNENIEDMTAAPQSLMLL